ncbi:hypothetical protein VHUM_02591 [Vanrija humicola]|uniref:Uncharacterized protein n=1 Tax=Vanrija humicola TaxID=5417 RepID=A0A7D8V0V1_VANHU|nr:hypothetical protein VHUM_02591 [Vanrija humicola]
MSLAALPKVTSYAVTDADAATIRDIAAQQEAGARFAAFNADAAWEVGCAIREAFLARRKGDQGVIIAIELFTGHRLFAAVVGAPPVVGPDNWAWAAAKTNVVRRFGVSSLRKGREFAAQGRTPEAKGLHFPEYACHGGGFPIYLANNDSGPIGAIVVSGLPQLDDHQLIVDALASLPHLLAK